MNNDKSMHIADTRLQDIAINEMLSTEEEYNHLNHCTQCTAELEAYTQLESLLETMPTESLHFDLTNKIFTHKLSDNPQRPKWKIAALIAIAVVIALAFYYLCQFIPARYHVYNLPLILSLFVIIGTSNMYDLYESYREKINQISNPKLAFLSNN
jgi:uncharacterized membrane-anchored protein